MSKEFDKENNVFNGNDISFMRPRKDTKVMIWGYELCNGAEWKDFLDVVSKLGKEKTDLEAKLAESEKNVEFYQERCANLSTSAYGADLMAKDVQWHLEKEITELKQQLAEKEKTIENLKNKWEILKDWFENKDWDACTSRDRALRKIQEIDNQKENRDESNR